MFRAISNALRLYAVRRGSQRIRVEGVVRPLARASNPEPILVRSRMYDDSEGAISMLRPGHLYRGMTQAEYGDTVGAGRGVLSKNLYSLAIEGTNFTDDPRSAESYANFGHTDPRKTGVPTYMVEIDPSGLPTVRRDRDDNLWTLDDDPKPVSQAWYSNTKRSGDLFIERNRQGDFWAHGRVPRDRVSRVWIMRPVGDDVLAEQIL